MTAASLTVRFTFVTGIAAQLFTAAHLKGSWDSSGRRSGEWTSRPMIRIRGDDGCPAFSTTANFDAAEIGQEFQWGVQVDDAQGRRHWAVMLELSRPDSRARHRRFRLSAAPDQHETNYVHDGRRLGAQKHYRNADADVPGIRFSLWAPHAQAVEVVIGDLWRVDDPAHTSLIQPDVAAPGARALMSAPRGEIAGGYIDDDGAGAHAWGPFPLGPAGDGIWQSDPTDPRLARFDRFDHVPYMFRVTRQDGSVAYRTDLYSRCQIGYGAMRPVGAYAGRTTELDGTVSCSVVVDPDRVATQFLEPNWPESQWTPQDEFFSTPAPDARLPIRDLQDLVIYELHVGALGFATRWPDQPGTLEDAIALLDHLQELGVNAVELLPLSEFGGGGAGWGYSTSHYFAIEFGGGGRDQYKWFIRECHHRGIAVILDVVYNHYHHDAARAEWMYDATDHADNAYYWFEGHDTDYADPRGGYVDNVSSGWAPRYHEEAVRRMFISSAIVLATEFKVDGLRVDQTTSIRAYNALHADGRGLPHVNAFGAKLLRELTRSLKFVAPHVTLIAEDHAGWDGLTRSSDEDGLGFDAGWYADFYHHLIGDTDKGDDYAKLLKNAGFGDDRPLAMDVFAGALRASGGRKVVYHESHDEAGNGEFTDRTINVAVNGAPLIGETRRVAEARCRFVAGVTLLSAGTPMFLFGEEVGAARKFLYGHVLKNREDLTALRHGSGRQLFDYYQALIRLRLTHRGLRSRDIEVLYVHNAHRLLVFRRCEGEDDFLVVGSLNNRPFDAPGYRFESAGFPSGRWREMFNSDAAVFGGWNIGNGGATLGLQGCVLECVVPSNSIVVFQRVST